jgi:hypothetical protein
VLALLLLGSIGCLADTQLIHAETSCDPFVVDFYVSDGSPSNCIEREAAANTMIVALELSSQVRKVVLKFPNRTQDPPENALHFIGMVLRNSGDDTFTTNVATELASSISPELRQLNDTVARSSTARIYSFPSELPLTSTIRETHLRREGEVDTDKLQLVRSYLPQIEAPRSFAPIEPCRFVPTVGIEFVGGQGAWWLLSVRCHDAVLLSTDQDWTRVRPIKIEPKIIEEILKLAK